MLLHKQGRFFTGSASFVLPDDCYLVIAEALNYHENGLEITDPEESFNISISAYMEELDAKSFLDDMLSSSSFVRLSETKAVKAGELEGYTVMYCDKRNIYSEYRFDLKDKDDINSLGIFIYANRTKDMVRINQSKMVTDLLNSLKIA